jgi:dihydroxyacetone kinase-like protein
MEGQELTTVMVDVAEKSAVSTIEMLAKKGRASYLGERSIGHQDPGATSSLLMIKALKQALAGS